MKRMQGGAGAEWNRVGRGKNGHELSEGSVCVGDRKGETIGDSSLANILSLFLALIHLPGFTHTCGSNSYSGLQKRFLEQWNQRCSYQEETSMTAPILQDAVLALVVQLHQ